MAKREGLYASAILCLSMVFVDTVDGRVIHFVQSVNWKDDVRARANVLLNPMAPAFSKTKPAPHTLS